MNRSIPGILSLHIPRSGGTTLLSMFQKTFNDRFHHQIGSKKTINPVDFDVIHGHFDINFWGDLKKEWFTICFVRDPVERWISHYHYWMERPDSDNFECIKMHNEMWTLDMFCERLKPEVVHRLIGNDYQNEIDFFGVLEQWDTSIAVLERLTGIKFVQVSKKNASRKISYNSYMMDKVRSIVRERNPIDYEIYNYAIKDLEEKKNILQKADN